MRKVKISDVKVFCLAPSDGLNLVIVKVETDRPEIYGLGCATFSYRYKAVACVVEEYLRPLLIGREAVRTEELWQLMNQNAYWRNGGIGNNAISGVDMALWDIKGKLAGMPVYDLLGGKCREAVPVYCHAEGNTIEEVIEDVRRLKTDGVRYIRIQLGGYGGRPAAEYKPDGALDGIYFDPASYCRETLKMFDAIREEFGDSIELLHDVHERLRPADALRFSKELEKYSLYYLEDAFSPEQADWYDVIRKQSAVPIAVGELFNNPREWKELLIRKQIDFVRCHISQIGGITPAKKLAVFAEQFDVRTAWHGPGDVSPVGHAANIHLDLSSLNMGIQEWAGINEILHEIFPGSPELKNGYVYIGDRPGLGIEFDETAVEKYPCNDNVTVWTQTRLPDGTIHRP